MLLELGVPERATMHVMGWSNSALAQRYQRVTSHALDRVATQFGAHLWTLPETAD